MGQTTRLHSCFRRLRTDNRAVVLSTPARVASTPKCAPHAVASRSLGRWMARHTKCTNRLYLQIQDDANHELVFYLDCQERGRAVTSATEHKAPHRRTRIPFEI